MTTFTSLRALVALVVALLTVFSLSSDGRPILPSSQLGKRTPQVTLLSTSPTPPLPALVLARDGRAATRKQTKAASFTRLKGSPPTNQRETVSEVKRDNVHDHIHEHVSVECGRSSQRLSVPPRYVDSWSLR